MFRYLVMKQSRSLSNKRNRKLPHQGLLVKINMSSCIIVTLTMLKMYILLSRPQENL